MTIVQIKKSTSSSQPSSLNFGELAIGNSGNDSQITIGKNDTTLAPINSLTVYTTTSITFTFPQWNSFLNLQTGSFATLTSLPKCTSYNKGQIIYVYNASTFATTISTNVADSFSGGIGVNYTIAVNGSVKFISDGNNKVYIF